jgi:hypothetical protein
MGKNLSPHYVIDFHPQISLYDYIETGAPERARLF